MREEWIRQVFERPWHIWFGLASSAVIDCWFQKADDPWQCRQLQMKINHYVYVMEVICSAQKTIPLYIDQIDAFYLDTLPYSLNDNVKKINWIE